MEGNVNMIISESNNPTEDKDLEIKQELDESETVLAQPDEENSKECNYFAEGQQHRIASMIRNGMEPEEALSKESERYAQLVAQWTANDTTVDSNTTACDMSSPEEHTTKEIREVNDKAESEEEKSTKNLNNFTGGQIKRIVAMIKCGIEPDKARDLEQERYDKFAAQKPNDAADTSIRTETDQQQIDDDAVAKKSSNDDKPKHNYEKFSNSQKRRISAMIRDGVQPETARKFERIRIARLQAQKVDETTDNHKRLPDNSLMQPEFKKPRHHSEMISNVTQQISRAPETQSKNIYYNYEVAIIHAKDPEVTLTLQEIYTIKANLLNEIDKSECSNTHHQFIENFINAGWWSITCQNMETKVWIMSTVPRLQLWPNANIKVVNTPNLYTCVTVLTVENVMPKHLFLSRLQKQNSDLRTGKWRLINVEKNSNNGETVTFSVDENSKEIILRQGQKLCLNFSQIYVRIEPRLPTRKRN